MFIIIQNVLFHIAPHPKLFVAFHNILCYLKRYTVRRILHTGNILK